jgi:hypothetical protein
MTDNPTNGADTSPQEPTDLEKALLEAESNQAIELHFDPAEAMTCRTISSMTDSQVEVYIRRLKAWLLRAEESVQSSRRKLAAAELEQNERAAARLRQKYPDRERRKKELGSAVEQMAAAMLTVPNKLRKPAKKIRPTSVADWLERKK